MTVQELINELKKFDPNKKVIVYATTDYQGGLFCDCDTDDVYEDNVTLTRTTVTSGGAITGPVNEDYVIISATEV